MDEWPTSLEALFGWETPKPKYMTVRSAAKLPQCSERTVRRYASQGLLKSYRLMGTRRLLIDEEHLLSQLREVEPTESAL